MTFVVGKNREYGVKPMYKELKNTMDFSIPTSHIVSIPPKKKNKAVWLVNMFDDKENNGTQAFATSTKKPKMKKKNPKIKTKPKSLGGTEIYCIQTPVSAPKK